MYPLEYDPTACPDGETATESRQAHAFLSYKDTPREYDPADNPFAQVEQRRDRTGWAKELGFGFMWLVMSFYVSIPVLAITTIFLANSRGAPYWMWPIVLIIAALSGFIGAGIQRKRDTGQWDWQFVYGLRCLACGIVVGSGVTFGITTLHVSWLVITGFFAPCVVAATILMIADALSRQSTRRSRALLCVNCHSLEQMRERTKIVGFWHCSIPGCVHYKQEKVRCQVCTRRPATYTFYDVEVCGSEACNRRVWEHERLGDEDLRWSMLMRQRE